MRRKTFLRKVERMVKNIASVFDRGRGPNFDPYYFRLSDVLTSSGWMEDLVEEEVNEETKTYYLRIGFIYARYVWLEYFNLEKHGIRR